MYLYDMRDKVRDIVGFREDKDNLQGTFLAQGLKQGLQLVACLHI